MPNKVTKEYMETRIKDVAYTVNETLTICIITLDNGFKSIGESACIDPANFNKELGEKYAKERAFEKLWPLFDFSLIERENVLYDEAVEIVLSEKMPAMSFLQRHLRIGYKTAQGLIQRMEKNGVISGYDENGKRTILKGL